MTLPWWNCLQQTASVRLSADPPSVDEGRADTQQKSAAGLFPLFTDITSAIVLHKHSCKNVVLHHWTQKETRLFSGLPGLLSCMSLPPTYFHFHISHRCMWLWKCGNVCVLNELANLKYVKLKTGRGWALIPEVLHVNPACKFCEPWQDLFWRFGWNRYINP